MPKLVEKRKVLGGRGSVVLYGSGSSAGCWFYRELIKGTKTYKTRKLDGVSNADEAEAAAVAIAFELAQSASEAPVTPSHSIPYPIPPKADARRQRRKENVGVAVEKWLAVERDRYNKNLISKSTLYEKCHTLTAFLLPYLAEQGVHDTSDINAHTFVDYPTYRWKTTAQVRKKELKTIKQWCSDYLFRNRLLNPILLLDKKFIPKVQLKQTDLLANPAICAEYWKLIIDFIRDEWRRRPLRQRQKSAWFFRNLFWHYMLFAKNTGMSPEEIFRLKWKQIDIVDVGRINSKGERVKWEVAYISTTRSKTQQTREIPANQARELGR